MSTLVVALAEVLKVLAAPRNAERWFGVRDLSKEAGVSYEATRKACMQLMLIGLLQKRERKWWGGGAEVQLKRK